MTLKEEKIYKEAFEEYINNQKMPSDEELEKIELSDEFKKSIENIPNTKKNYKVITAKKVLQKVAAIVIVCGLMAGVYAMGIFAKPSDKKETTVKDIIELHNSVMYETEKVKSCYYSFSYLPEGYGDEISGGGDGKSIMHIFENEKREEIVLIQYMKNIPLPEIDRFGVEYEKINGGLYIYNVNNGKTRYIWSDLGYVFEIRAVNCSVDELLKMRDSLIII